MFCDVAKSHLILLPLVEFKLQKWDSTKRFEMIISFVAQPVWKYSSEMQGVN